MSYTILNNINQYHLTFQCQYFSYTVQNHKRSTMRHIYLPTLYREIS